MNKNKLLNYRYFIGLLILSLCNFQYALASGYTTDKDFVQNLNILINNVLQIFVKTSAALAILTGIIAFVVQLVRINVIKDNKRRDAAMRNLLEVSVSTGLILLLGLIFTVVYYIVTSA